MQEDFLGNFVVVFVTYRQTLISGLLEILDNIGVMHQSIPSTNIPPGATPGVLHSTAAPGPGFILVDLPGGWVFAHP